MKRSLGYLGLVGLVIVGGWVVWQRWKPVNPQPFPPPVIAPTAAEVENQPSDPF